MPVDARLYIMKSRTLKTAVTVICVLLISLLLVNSCTWHTPEEPDTETPNIPDTSTPDAPETEEPSVAPTPDEETPSPDVQPPETDVPEITPEPSVEPEYDFGAPVPLAESVDDEWFSDAAFLGNSLVDGFRLFSGLTTCDVYAATSMTVMGAGSLITQMSAEQYGKVYILLGVNEIGFDAEYFKSLYADMLDTIMEQQPDADIYIMGLTPVSAHKSSTDRTFTMDRIRLYNETLLDLAEEKGCYYIDLVEALSDDSGYLPASVTTDGVHFAASHYQVWLEYLRTHHV